MRQGFKRETDKHPDVRPGPQLPADPNIPEQARDDEDRQDDKAYDVEDQPRTVVEEYQIETPPHLRRAHLGLSDGDDQPCACGHGRHIRLP